MKSTRPPLLDAPMSPRRKRALSEEERALWHSVAKQTKPLRKKARIKKMIASASTEMLPAAPKNVAPSKPLSPMRLLKPKLNAPKSAPQLSPLGRRERSQLSRGRKQIDARIDLHGMTQHRAHGALLTFLHRASHDGMTFVLVITGKGRTVGPESERGILRRQVPLWLGLPEFRVLVVGYEEAGIGHGGEGALYVRMRRGR